ncbi:MAG TPA: hypothetical protein VJB97_04700 [Candidatus Paceibacterota bacterium]
MNMATKKDIFEEHLPAWRKARNDRKQRGEIRGHVCFVTGMHKNSVSRKFRSIQMRDPLRADRRGRAVFYTPDVTAALKEIWDVGDEACGELLHPQIREYVLILKRDKLWTHSAEATEKLLVMSEHTVRRRVAEFEKARGIRKGLSSTKPSALKSIIPIFKGPWKDLPPGHEQIDTVAHCGETLLGDFAYSLSAIDSAVYWTNTRAQWNKGQEATAVSMDAIWHTLPFPWLSAHPDTGTEFINAQVKGWCDAEGITMSRSEPGKKNDNMYVEERNGHVVRKYLGYRRFDCPDVVPLMNDFYRVMGLYLNHFKAVRRQIEKVRVGAKYVRKYEKVAKTPYQRVLEHPAVDTSIKAKLRMEHTALNPLILKREMDRLLVMVNNQ